MKMIKCLYLMLCMVVTIGCGPNVNSQEAEKQKLPYYDQLTHAVVRIQEHKSTCTPGLINGIEEDVNLGTAFFILDKYKSKNRLYIVTARHVVEAGKADLFIKLKQGLKSSEFQVLELPRQYWVFHEEEMNQHYFPIDVAVMEISMPKYGLRNFLFCETGEDCGKKENGDQKINQLTNTPNVMDQAIFLGFPKGDVDKESAEPFVRSGVVAYTANHSSIAIQGKRIPPDSMYFIDAPSFGGNSGGPVINLVTLLNSGVKVWGLVSAGNISGRDYALITRPEKIAETIQYARRVGKLNPSQWLRETPKLPLICKQDT